MEAEQNLEIQFELSTTIRNDLNKEKSYLMYKLVEGINLIHYRNRIYVTETLCKRVLKFYHCYFHHQGGSRLSQTLTYICRWSGIVVKNRNFAEPIKTVRILKSVMSSMGYFLVRILKPWRHAIQYV